MRVMPPIKRVRVPKSDVDAAKDVETTRFAKTDNSKKFAIMGTAILEKLCRSGKLRIRSKRTTPYILDTARGKIGLSVMVSAVNGGLSNKHMVVPVTALGSPPGTVEHVLVCAFVSKLERIREEHGGLNVKLAGWATADEVSKHTRDMTRVATVISVATVPVHELHPIQTLRHYLAPSAAKANNQKTDNKE